MKPISLLDPNSVRVYRGGCWYDSMLFARVASPLGGPPSYRFGNLGFRLYIGVR